MDVRTTAARIEQLEAIDSLEPALQKVAARFLQSRKVKDALHGTWLGHPLHPVLTDLPIGFWTASWVLDLFGGKRGRRASDTMILLGLASAVPTAASGLADWTELDPPARRSATVHALCNAIATLYYLRSLMARIRGRRARGVRLAMMGATMATVGAYLGGHLVYRRASGVDRSELEEPPPGEWTLVADEASLQDGKPVLAQAGGRRVLLVRTGDRIRALGDACSHMGGPLHEGTIDHAGHVTCPWHGSVFDLESGAVVHGPAVAPMPCYEVRVADGKVEIRSAKR